MSVKIHEEWMNRKNGNVYEVVGLATCCDNDKDNQTSIIYTAEGNLYTRCKDEFLQKFTRVKGKTE